MNDAQFEAIMDAWTDEELRSAPALQPTAEMRRMVEARRSSSSAAAFRPWKWVALAAAAAVIVWFGRGYFSPAPHLPQSFEVSLHAPPPGLETLRVEGPAPLETGPKSRGGGFAQVLLQSHAPGGETVVGVEHDGEEAVTIPLDEDDLFRLALLPLGDRHVHVYVAKGEELTDVRRLFPAKGDEDDALLKGHAPRFVPSVTAWFRVEGATPGHRIVLISSRDPLGDFEPPSALRAIRGGTDVDVWEFVLRAR